MQSRCGRESRVMAASLGGRFLLYTREGKYLEASGRVLSREKRKQTRRGQDWVSGGIAEMLR